MRLSSEDVCSWEKEKVFARRRQSASFLPNKSTWAVSLQLIRICPWFLLNSENSKKTSVANYWWRRMAPKLQVFNSWNEITLQDFFEITLQDFFEITLQDFFLWKISSIKFSRAALGSTFNPLCWKIIDQTIGASSFQLLVPQITLSANTQGSTFTSCSGANLDLTLAFILTHWVSMCFFISYTCSAFLFCVSMQEAAVVPL